MSTGQTMMTIFAFVLLVTTLTTFYRLLGNSGDDISSGQDGILSTTIATSYMEVAQGLAFDEQTDTTDAALYDISVLTDPINLGPDNGGETNLHTFNDFDDFHGNVFEKEAAGTGRKYATQFSVQYVDESDIAEPSLSRSYIKRMDMKTWRVFPPTPRADTLRLSLVLGYFHFD